ncbi:hypothetical protein THRCLA_21930 [Thraustotheca clavata]|uniref:Uncharacterized protein n=1 Tax=Thraustotheca clavata TaxID=74557 RepID=A0A1V9ZHI6_9STRA|nr:hypothetical protein THRCLA_21930 [Thraustotheca clavata]
MVTTTPEVNTSAIPDKNAAMIVSISIASIVVAIAALALVLYIVKPKANQEPLPTEPRGEFDIFVRTDEIPQNGGAIIDHARLIEDISTFSLDHPSSRRDGSMSTMLQTKYSQYVFSTISNDSELNTTSDAMFYLMEDFESGRCPPFFPKPRPSSDLSSDVVLLSAGDFRVFEDEILCIPPSTKQL